MKRTLLVTRPCYDEATNYLFYYAGLLISEAESKGIPVLDLKRPRLTRKIFTNIIDEHKPGFVFFNAHGDEKTIYGDRIGKDDEVLVRENDNHNILDSRIVYARSCCSAASLGEACEGGCFIGYRVPFSFWIDERWSSKPSNDDIARLFLEPSNLVVSSLLKGNNAKEAVDKSLNLSKKNIMRLLEEKEEPGAMASVMLLWNNMAGLCIAGDESMRFE